VSYAVLVPVGPGNQANVLDTLASLFHFCPADCRIFLVDDCTSDGTYDLLRGFKDPRVSVLRNSRPQRYNGLVRTLALGLTEIAKIPGMRLVLKTDTDALMTGHGVFEDAAAFVHAHPRVGIFGRHLINYDGTPKDFSVLTAFFQREMRFPRNLIPGRTGYMPILHQALKNGWQLGENVFGGAYFLTGDCLRKMAALGHLDLSRSTRTAVAEDSYFTMCAVAAGFDRAQFAYPVGPMGLAYTGLPAPAKVLAEAGMKIVHTVDKGKFTSRDENGGLTPREFFAQLREMT
jgi:hypothetical protein